mgnify:FL=1
MPMLLRYQLLLDFDTFQRDLLLHLHPCAVIQFRLFNFLLLKQLQPVPPPVLAHQHLLTF